MAKKDGGPEAWVLEEQELAFFAVVGWAVVSQRSYVQIPRTCEHVTFCGKGDFAAVITLNIMREGGYLGMSR